MAEEPRPTTEDIDKAPTGVPATIDDTQLDVARLINRLAEVGEERDELAAELEKTKKRVRTIEILDELIEPMANKAFWFMCTYAFVVGAILALDGFKRIEFDLPDGVLEFLVGSTAATVIGLVGMVLTGIFIGARRTND